MTRHNLSEVFFKHMQLPVDGKAEMSSVLDYGVYLDAVGFGFPRILQPTLAGG